MSGLKITMATKSGQNSRRKTAEAEAFFTRAKKQRAEVEKARGFFKEGVLDKDREKDTNPLKSKLACSECGKLHHWHKAPECPMFGKPFPNRGGKGKKKEKRKKNKKKN